MDALSEEIAEAKRELRMRYQVYPGMVTRQRMTQEQMDRYITLQHRIVARLEALQVSPQLSLLGEDI